MLVKFEKKSYLNNTMLILMGDHGNRLKYYAYATEQGKLERWMPFLELVQFELNASPNDLDNNRLQLYVGYRLRQNPNIRDTIILTF
jgi:hypothetical protein